MNIYQIDAAILELVDPETGEIENWEAFERLQMEREQKIENVACLYKNVMAEAAAIRQEELNLAKRRQSNEKTGERLKKYLEVASVEELEDKDYSVQESLEIVLKDLELLKAQAEAIRKLADEEDHYGLVASMEDQLGNYRKNIWFIKAMLK